MSSKLNQLRRKLAALEQAELDLINTGQEYAVVGAYSTKNLTLKEIEHAIATVRRQILSRQGLRIRRTYPNNNGSSGGIDS